MGKYVYVLLIILLSFQLEAQNIPIYTDYSAFESLLQKDNDTTYVVNFWATWCIPCVREMPAFQQLSQDYKGEKVKVLLVSIDMAEKLDNSVIPLLARKNITAPVVILDDPHQNSWIDKVSTQWQGSIPATLIYNKEKRIFFEQSFNYTELDSVVKTFLN